MASIKDKIKIEQYIKKANQVEEQYGIPKNLLVGLLKAESGFDPNVISGRRKSSAGALGIAQFMPATAKEFGINPLNPSQAIDAAGRYLSQNYKKLGNWDDTLRSYNMGLGNVYKWKQGKIKLPKETADYVGKVYSNMGAGSNIQMVGDQVRETMNSFIPPTFIPKFVNYGGTGYSSIDTGAEVEEDTKEVLEAKQQIDKVTTEQQIIEDFFAQSQPQQQLAQQEQVQEPQYEVPSLGEQYQQVSQFVDQPIAQQGGVINREAFNKLSKEQQDIIKKEINFNRNWFNRRENTFDKEGKPIPVEKGIFNNVTAFNPKVKSDKEMEEYYAYYSPKTDVTSLRRDFTKFPGTIAHERTHQYQTHMTPENWNKYINLPSAYSMSLNTLMKNARGDEDEFTKYMRDPSEIHSFIQEVRYLNNLDPTVPVTDEMVKKLKYDKSNTLKDYYSDEEIKNFLNSMVSTQPKSYDTIAQQGGKISFNDWYKTIPITKKDTTSYNLKRAYELAPQNELDDFVNNPEAHLYSAYPNPKTGEWEFMKSKHHPTIQYELDWFNSNDPEAVNFRNKYNIDMSGEYYKYVPKKQQGGNIPVSSQGVYDYPMQEVIVPTQDGRITMKNVNYPILGVDEYGNTQMMYPNQEYQYSGKVIHEIPQLSMLQEAGYANIKPRDERLQRRIVKETIPPRLTEFLNPYKEKEDIIPTIDTLKAMRPDIKTGQGIYFGTGDKETYISPDNALKEVVIKGYKKPSNQINTKNIVDKNAAKEIQKKLVDFGYDLGTSGEGNKGIDGIVGNRTREAIKSYNEIIKYQEEYNKSKSTKKVEDFIVEKLGDRKYNKRELEIFRDSNYIKDRPDLIDEDVKKQVESNKKSGLIDSNYLVISDKNSRGYVFDKDSNLIKSFKTVTGKNTGEESKISSKEWVKNNPGKNFTDYIDYLEKTGQKYTPSGIYFVGKKDKTYSELKADSFLGEAKLKFNEIFRPEETERRRASREHSYGNVGLISLKRLSGKGIGEAIHSTGTEERTKNLEGISTAENRKMSSGCINVGNEDLGFCFNELDHNTPVFLLREDEKVMSPQVLKYAKASKQEREIANGLYNNYEKLKKDFGDEVDNYINYSTGILGNESSFGNMSLKGEIKETLAKNSLVRKLAGKKGDASVGAAQIKWSGLTTELKDKLRSYGIEKPSDLEDINKSAIAAMYFLKKNVDEKGSLEEGIKGYLGASEDSPKVRHYIKKVKD